MKRKSNRKSPKRRKRKRNRKKKRKRKKKTFNIREKLTEDQIKSLDALRAKVKDEMKTKREEEWVNDMCLNRYLKARDWDLEKAAVLLKGTLQWRRSYKPHLITAEDVLIELKNEGKMYKNGKDKIGRPVIYMKPGKDNTGAPEREYKVKYLVYLMEKAVRSMNESAGVDKLVLIIDYKDYNGLAGISMTKISKEILNILQDHYPERLGIVFLFNVPVVFTLFWKMLSPFLTESTKSKVKFINEKTTLLLHELIEPDQLEVDYGGKNTFTYNFEKHWNKEDLEYPVEKESESESK